MAKRKVKKYPNILFHYNYLKIGGCEQYEYEIAYKYHNLGYELDMFYMDSVGDEQINRLVELLGIDHVHKYAGEQIYCENLFINYEFSGFLENVIADNVYNVNHANFLIQKELKLHDSPKITKRIGVSETVSKAYQKRFNLKCETIYNPITIREHDRDRVLTIVSATRLTKEKGLSRMINLINLFEANGIKFYWHIFTNDIDRINSPNVFYHKPRLDIRPYLANADYVCQLSDTEGYCYTILESLCLGTPVLCTDLEVFREMGVVNGENGFLFPLDMSYIPLDDILRHKKKFVYTPKRDTYDKLLSLNKIKEVEIEMVKVKPLQTYYDVFEKVHITKQRVVYPDSISLVVGEVYETTEDRAKILEEKGLVEIVGSKPRKIKRTKKC